MESRPTHDAAAVAVLLAGLLDAAVAAAAVEPARRHREARGCNTHN